MFILVLVEAPGRKHSGFGADVSCQNVRSKGVLSNSLYVCGPTHFYVTQPTKRRSPMAACKMWPIWRRRMVGFGEFPFVSHGCGRGRPALLAAACWCQSLCIWLPLQVAEVEKVIYANYAACVSYIKFIIGKVK